jgi:uncharacterized membrane protein
MTLAEIAQHLDGSNEELSSVIGASLVDRVERRLAEELGFEQCGICGYWGYAVSDDGCAGCIES